MLGATPAIGDEQGGGDLDGSLVHGLPLDGLSEAKDDDAGVGNLSALAVRNGEAAHHTRGTLGLARLEGLCERGRVRANAELGCLLCGKVKSLVTSGNGAIKDHVVSVEQCHWVSPLPASPRRPMSFVPEAWYSRAGQLANRCNRFAKRYTKFHKR